MGKLAGVSPVAGLYATMLPLVTYALFGSSRQLVVGPDGVLAILTATTIAPLAAGEPARYAALAAALALIMGVIHIVCERHVRSWPGAAQCGHRAASPPRGCRVVNATS
jgi:SulP family sulfate permease